MVLYSLTMRTGHREVCQHPGCHESQHYEFSSQRELQSWLRKRPPFFCIRHNPNGHNLQPDSPERTVTEVLTVEAVGDLGHFFRRPDAAEVAGGFKYGNDWNAFAADFPIGTKIVVTTQIQVILPQERQ